MSESCGCVWNPYASEWDICDTHRTRSAIELERDHFKARCRALERIAEIAKGMTTRDIRLCDAFKALAQLDREETDE